MNTPIALLASLVLSLAVGASVHAQGDEWRTLHDEARSLYQTGQYDRALVAARKALEVAEKTFGPDHPIVASSMDNLAGLYRTQGQYAQAEPLYERSLSIRDKALGPDHPDVVRLNNLAGDGLLVLLLGVIALVTTICLVR